VNLSAEGGEYDPALCSAPLAQKVRKTSLEEVSTVTQQRRVIVDLLISDKCISFDFE
jgi:hypothetical protein